MKIDKSLTIALIVAIAMFMQILDMTAVTTAIPKMAEDFHTSIIRLNLGITSYIITMSIFIPIGGWMANRFGTKTVFSISIFVFIFGSAFCGLSNTLHEFIFHRIIQGVGGAMMTPVGRLAVLRAANKSTLVLAMAFLTWPALLAPVIGPLLGGYFATYVSWHWIFYINVPIGVICIILSLIFIPKEDIKSRIKIPFDFVGFLLLGMGFAGIMISVELLSYQKNSYYIISAICAVLSILFIWFDVMYSRQRTNPLVNFSVMKLRTFSNMIYAGSISRLIIDTLPFLIPLMFQTGFGYTPFKAGLMFAVTVIGSLIMKPFTVWLIRKFTFRNILLANGALVALSTLSFTLFFPHTPIFLVIGGLFLAGVFWCIQFSTITTLAFADLPPENMNDANTLYSTLLQISIGTGIALGGVLLHFANIFNKTHIGVYPLKDYHLSFIIIAALVLFSSLGFLRLHKDAGDSVRNLKPSKETPMQAEEQQEKADDEDPE